MHKYVRRASVISCCLSYFQQIPGCIPSKEHFCGSICPAKHKSECLSLMLIYFIPSKCKMSDNVTILIIISYKRTHQRRNCNHLPTRTHFLNLTLESDLFFPFIPNQLLSKKYFFTKIFISFLVSYYYLPFKPNLFYYPNSAM